jgi:ABC-type uncharacterized transport system ATPase subunit
MQAAVQVEKLVKRFDRTFVVDDIPSAVPQGEWFGPTVPAGAGHTKTFPILSTRLFHRRSLGLES